MGAIIYKDKVYGAGGSIIEGYYKSADGKFYEETTYETEIPGAEDLLYIDLTSKMLFIFDGTNFVNITEDAKPTVTEASSRTNIASGDTLKTIIGKIKKFFADLKAVAFTGAYSDLTGTPSIPTKTSDLTNDSGFVTTDEKVTGEEKKAANGAFYNIPFIGTNNQKPYYNDGLQMYTIEGTSSAAGRNIVLVGNNVSTGTAGNKRGEIRIYSEKDGYALLRSTVSSTHERVIYFPDKAGTVALTDEVTPYKGNLRTEIGDAAPAAATKTYWENNVNPFEVSTAYDNKGDEYTILFSKGETNNYGNILKWGYADKYLRILRKNSNGWLDSDWAKMDAGYADIAGKLNPYFCYYRVCALKTTLGATITGGWYRVCKVEGASFDANFIIHTSGDWNTTAPTNATVLVNTVNSGASITQLGGKLYTNMITKIRLVSVSGNIFWLDVYIGGSSSSVTRDNSQFLDLYGQVHVFEEQNPTAPYTQTVTAAASIDLKAISGNVITSEGGTITGSLTGAGAKFQGRYYGSGDDEGIIIDFCSNNYAGLCLGSPTGKRSVFYLTSGANALPFWRYNAGGGTNYDIQHPGKAGTIALTSDITGADTKVTQTNTTTNTYYRVLLSHKANDTEETDTVYKNGWLTYNPYVGRLDTKIVCLGMLGSTTGFTYFCQNNSNYKVELSAPGSSLTADRTITFPNSAGTISVSGSSSRRTKKNIENMTDVEAKKLLDLRPVKFDYITEEDGTDCYGLIAEEVQDAGIEYPVFTHHDKRLDEDVPALEYSKFVPYLIKMVQLQQQEIDLLKQEVADLKNRI